MTNISLSPLFSRVSSTRAPRRCRDFRYHYSDDDMIMRALFVSHAHDIRGPWPARTVTRSLSFRGSGLQWSFSNASPNRMTRKTNFPSYNSTNTHSLLRKMYPDEVTISPIVFPFFVSWSNPEFFRISNCPCAIERGCFISRSRAREHEDQPDKTYKGSANVNQRLKHSFRRQCKLPRAARTFHPATYSRDADPWHDLCRATIYLDEGTPSVVLFFSLQAPAFRTATSLRAHPHKRAGNPS